MSESALQSLLKRELKALDKQIAEVEDLVHGCWYRKLLSLQQLAIDRTRTMTSEQAIAYLQGIAPQEKALAKKAKQSKNIGKLLDEQLALEKTKRELNRELDRIVLRDEESAAFWAEHDARMADS